MEIICALPNSFRCSANFKLIRHLVMAAVDAVARGSSPASISRRLCRLAGVACLGLILASCGRLPKAKDDEALAEARKSNKDISPQEAAAKFYPSVIEDYFPGMDPIVEREKAPVSQLLDREPAAVFPHPGAVVLNEKETLGRNSWMIWCGGNERFWNWLASNGFGFVDLLKVVDSRGRDARFRDAGLINEPLMRASRAEDKDKLGLWLDVPEDEDLRKWRADYIRRAFGLDETDGTKGKSYETEAAQAYEYTPKIPPPGIYGLSSGVVGLRIFPNPDFIKNKDARKNWKPESYYNDPGYYNDPNLIRPFRVGMSCAFCHASFHPLNPPRDVTKPKWANISGNIGAQYLRIRAIFGNLLQPDSLIYHILDAQPPGTIDTSLIASDNINNPNTMNSIFGVPERVVRSFLLPKEDLSGVSAGEPSLWGNPKEAAPVTEDIYGKTAYASKNTYHKSVPTRSDDKVPESYTKLFDSLGLGEELRNSNDGLRRVPRILLDGSDSVGAWVALARVYLNIGTYSERWNELHNPLVGFKPQSPFTITDAQEHSAYWHATQPRVAPMRDYFLKVTPPMPLLAVSASATQQGPRIDVSKLKDGRRVFAHNCIACHSSLQPETLFVDGKGSEQADSYRQARASLMVKKEEASALLAEFGQLAQDRRAYLDQSAEKGEFWDHDPGKWLRDPTYRKWAEKVVEEESFWKNNYLSSDYRVPITLVRTNAGRAMATNGMTGRMWQDFASESYRKLPSVGAIDFYNPYPWPDQVAGRKRIFGDKFPYPFKPGANGDEAFLPAQKAPAGVDAGGGGPGYYRVPTLISIWSTAPLLHNNSLGTFNNDPSTEGRLAAFDDAIRKLLWPERRFLSSSYNGATPERLRKDHGLIWRTPQETWVNLPARYVAPLLTRAPSLMAVAKVFKDWFGWLDKFPRWLPSALLFVLAFAVLMWLAFKKWLRWLGYGFILLGLLIGLIRYFETGGFGDVRIGPIPKGVPVNLLANVNPEADRGKLIKTVGFLVTKLAEIESRHLKNEPAKGQSAGTGETEADRIMREEIAPALMEVSKCPDFVMDKGHYYEWFKDMTNEDKEALIELLKTF